MSRDMSLRDDMKYRMSQSCRIATAIPVWGQQRLPGDATRSIYLRMSSAFARTQWTAAAATLAAGAAMLLYPGGTARDPGTVGYRMSGNFLSDLGMTVAWDGRPNRLGAVLFVASMALMIVGIGGALLGFVARYAGHPRARRLATLAGALGVLDCLCFIGVALAPEDRAMAAHVAFTLAAFRILPLVVFVITLAAAATPATPRAVIGAWAFLTLVLLGYALMLQGGSWVATPAGFAAQVIAQKVVAIVMGAVVVFQSRTAHTLSGRLPRRAPRQT